MLEHEAQVPHSVNSAVASCGIKRDYDCEDLLLHTLSLGPIIDHTDYTDHTDHTEQWIKWSRYAEHRARNKTDLRFRENFASGPANRECKDKQHCG